MSAPLRVLVLTNRFPPDSEGGYEISCALAVQALRDRGHHVVVLTRRQPTLLGDRDTHRVLFDRNSGDRSLLLVGWFMESMDTRRLRHLLELVDADVAYLWGATGLSVRVIATITRALPTVVYVADYWFADWISGSRLPDGFAHQICALATRTLIPLAGPSRAVNRAFSLVDSHLYRRRMAATPSIVQFDSQHMADDLRRRNIVLANSRILPHGIDIRKFPYVDPLVRTCVPPQVLFAGRVVPQKGVETLLSAVALMRREMPEVKLTFAGPVDPGYAASLTSAVTQLGLEGCVELLGNRTQEELQLLYQNHTALAFPSEWAEPFGIVLLEAMASGLPTVSSAAGGSREIVDHGVNGLVFERGNSVDLARTLTSLVSSASLCSQLAREARTHVELKYDLRGMVDAIEQDLIATARGDALGS